LTEKLLRKLYSFTHARLSPSSVAHKIYNNSLFQRR
jgi:hypothetical protein